MKDLMIDLETCATSHDAKVISAAAVYFDITTGERGPELYHKFDIDLGINRWRYEDHGPDGSMTWWSKQDAGVYAEAFSGTENINDFLALHLPAFVHKNVKPWGNGASFDIALIDNMYAMMRRKAPWKFWDVMDVRTVVRMAQGLASKTKPPVGQAHHPIYDCYNQIEYVCNMYAALRNGR